MKQACKIVELFNRHIQSTRMDHTAPVIIEPERDDPLSLIVQLGRHQAVREEMPIFLKLDKQAHHGPKFARECFHRAVHFENGLQSLQLGRELERQIAQSRDVGGTSLRDG